MKKSRLHNPADYNPVANPDLPKTNSPWRFWGAVILAGVVLFGAWEFFQPPVQISQPVLELSADRVVATAVATNDTNEPIKLMLRFVLAQASPGSDTHPGFYSEIAHREMEIRIPARSKENVSCEFPRSQLVQPRVDVQILSKSASS